MEDSGKLIERSFGVKHWGFGTLKNKDAKKTVTQFYDDHNKQFEAMAKSMDKKVAQQKGDTVTQTFQQRLTKFVGKEEIKGKTIKQLVDDFMSEDGELKLRKGVRDALNKMTPAQVTAARKKMNSVRKWRKIGVGAVVVLVIGLMAATGGAIGAVGGLTAVVYATALIIGVDVWLRKLPNLFTVYGNSANFKAEKAGSGFAVEQEKKMNALEEKMDTILEAVQGKTEVTSGFSPEEKAKVIALDAKMDQILNDFNDNGNTEVHAGFTGAAEMKASMEQMKASMEEMKTSMAASMASIAKFVQEKTA